MPTPYDSDSEPSAAARSSAVDTSVQYVCEACMAARKKVGSCDRYSSGSDEARDSRRYDSAPMAWDSSSATRGPCLSISRPMTGAPSSCTHCEAAAM